MLLSPFQVGKMQTFPVACTCFLSLNCVAHLKKRHCTLLAAVSDVNRVVLLLLFPCWAANEPGRCKADYQGEETLPINPNKYSPLNCTFLNVSPRHHLLCLDYVVSLDKRLGGRYMLN